jgi:hypothetical protein
MYSFINLLTTEYGISASVVKYVSLYFVHRGIASTGVNSDTAVGRGHVSHSSSGGTNVSTTAG